MKLILVRQMYDSQLPQEWAEKRVKQEISREIVEHHVEIFTDPYTNERGLKVLQAEFVCLTSEEYRALAYTVVDASHALIMSGHQELGKKLDSLVRVLPNKNTE